SCLSSILELRLPAGCTLGDQVEEVPDTAEVVARRERGVGDPNDARPDPFEYRDAWPWPLLPIAHVLGKGAALARHHRIAPSARGSDPLLLLVRNRREEHECGTVAQMLEDAVESVGPQGAVGAARSHVVDHQQRVLVAEQLRQARIAAAGAGKRVVLD